MSGEKIWMRLSSETLAAVDQRRGQQTRSEALRELIICGLVASPSPDMPTATDDEVVCKITRQDRWAVEMAAWFLQSASASAKPVGADGESTRWIVFAPTENVREWSAWASALRSLVKRIGGDL